jgi:hypothetical protein
LCGIAGALAGGGGVVVVVEVGAGEGRTAAGAVGAGQDLVGGTGGAGALAG